MHSYQEALAKLVEEMIEKPFSRIDYNQPIEEVIKEMDGLVDGYIVAAKKLVEVHLIQSYQEGVEDATDKLNSAAEQYNLDYIPLVSDLPEKL